MLTLNFLSIYGNNTYMVHTFNDQFQGKYIVTVLETTEAFDVCGIHLLKHTGHTKH
jgi:hypothetical protein